LDFRPVALIVSLQSGRGNFCAFLSACRLLRRSNYIGAPRNDIWVFKRGLAPLKKMFPFSHRRREGVGDER